MKTDYDRCKCGACGWEGDVDECKSQHPNIPDEITRMDPGGECPAGECPECESLTYVLKLKPYTVFGHYMDSRENFSYHVMAVSQMHAFYVAANEYEITNEYSLVFEGHLKEYKDFSFAGDSVVDGETVRDQKDVFA